MKTRGGGRGGRDDGEGEVEEGRAMETELEGGRAEGKDRKRRKTSQSVSVCLIRIHNGVIVLINLCEQ